MEVEERVAPRGGDEVKLQEIVEKEEKFGRSMTGAWAYLVSGLGIFMVLFYFYQAGIAPVDNQYSLGFYVTLTYIMVFFLYPMTKKSPLHRPTLIDLVLCLITIVTIGYWMAEFEDLNYRMGAETDLDTLVSVVGILLSLEVARRVLGLSLTIVGVVFLLYSFWGDLLAHIPIIKAFSHTGFSYKQSVNHIFLKWEGVFGIMADVLVTYVILFIFFGSFLKKSGAAKFFPGPAPGHSRQGRGRPGQGGGHRLRVFRLGLGKRHRQHGLHRHLHHPAHEKGRVQAPRGRGHRAGRLHRGHVHAAHHGRGRVHHVRDDRGALRGDHEDGRVPRDHLFPLGLRHDPFRGQALRPQGQARARTIPRPGRSSRRSGTCPLRW